MEMECYKKFNYLKILKKSKWPIVIYYALYIISSILN